MRLRRFNHLSDDDARAVLTSCLNVDRREQLILDCRPYKRLDDLFRSPVMRPVR